jgi:hypothetical protein
MEWISNHDQNMDIDIGFQARMELISSAPSNKLKFDDTESNSFKRDEYYRKRIKQFSNDSYQKLIDKIRWKEEIGIEEAYENLEKYFYRFREVINYLPNLYSIDYSNMLQSNKVKYYSFFEAFKEAKKLNKLVHCIILWGVLNDQSC